MFCEPIGHKTSTECSKMWGNDDYSTCTIHNTIESIVANREYQMAANGGQNVRPTSKLANMESMNPKFESDGCMTIIVETLPIATTTFGAHSNIGPRILKATVEKSKQQDIFRCGCLFSNARTNRVHQQPVYVCTPSRTSLRIQGMIVFLFISSFSFSNVSAAQSEKHLFKPSIPGHLANVQDVAAALDAALESGLYELNIPPEPLCTDVAFLRRASLDLTGQIPEPEEVINFFHDADTGKRSRKIKEILDRSEYADHWATFWSVLMVGRHAQERPDVNIALFRIWLRQELGKNVPFDKWVTALLTASGPNNKSGPANYLSFHLNNSLPNAVAHLSRTFLGARVGCAQCHDHPFDKWSQQDFWSFAACFGNTTSVYEIDMKKKSVLNAWHVLADSDSRIEGPNYDPPNRDLLLPPKMLDGTLLNTDEPVVIGRANIRRKQESPQNNNQPKTGTRNRQGIAAWLTHASNEKFAQAAVNHLWSALFGYGLVEPVDDLRPNNPPSHPEVMNILVNDFNASGRDLKRLLSIIANTQAYQRSTSGPAVNAERQKAVRYAARAEVRPMTPEMLLTAIVKATGGAKKVSSLLKDLRERDEAVLAGRVDRVSNEIRNFHALLQRFVGPSSAEDGSGKLQFEGTVLQALMMMNSPFMIRSIHEGVNRFKYRGMGDMIYLFAATLGRPPTQQEATTCSQFNGTLEELLWILLNTAEFETIH